jgi:hypothetical protein
MRPTTPRWTGVLPGYASFNRSGRYLDPYLYSDAFLRAREEEIVLRGKLKRCEILIRAKGKKIQGLEERLGKTKPKQLSS